MRDEKTGGAVTRPWGGPKIPKELPCGCRTSLDGGGSNQTFRLKNGNRVCRCGRVYKLIIKWVKVRA